MIIWLIVAIAVAFACALLGRSLARRKNRSVFKWGLVAALIPPALVILLMLPKRKRDE